MHAPTAIKGLNSAEVRVTWDDDTEPDIWSARELRLQCACAHCIHEFTGAKLLDPTTVAEDIIVTTIELVGNYGIKVGFSDGHDNGIYRFKSLWGAKQGAAADDGGSADAS